MRKLAGFAAVLLGLAEAAGGQAFRELVTRSKEMEFDAHIVTGSDWQSPLITYKGSIYYGWVDAKLRTRIARKTPDGKVTTHVIFAQTDDDPWHNGVSLGIDRDGYIHVAGNMHHSPYSHPKIGNPYYKHAWQYMVSDRPADISAFTFRGGDPERTIPGAWITYPYFARDRKGVLYVSFRHRVKFGIGWSPGIIAGAIARYDADAKAWTMLGGAAYVHGVKTFAWSPKGAGGTAYQGYKSHLFFDRKDRLHVTWVVSDGTHATHVGTHASHVYYAYSDDGGDTFHKASGAPYRSLPITPDNGDRVVGPPFPSGKLGLWYRSYVGVLGDGRPVVAFSKHQEGTAWWSRWGPVAGAWSAPTRFPSRFPARILTDANGVLTAVDNNRLHRSVDLGVSWESYKAATGGLHSTNFDYLYFAETNQLRYQTYSVGVGRVAVWTVAFACREPRASVAISKHASSPNTGKSKKAQ